MVYQRVRTVEVVLELSLSVAGLGWIEKYCGRESFCRDGYLFCGGYGGEPW